MANIYGTLNPKGAISSGGGGHANLRTYDDAITPDNNEPNLYHLDISQAYIITDLATGQTPTSYNKGDVVYGTSQDSNGVDKIQNIYIVNSVENDDLILEFKMKVKGSLLTTTTDAIYSSNEYSVALSNLSDTPSINDYVAYINNDAITTLYQVASIDWQYEYAVLNKIGDFGGGGSQRYQHNIFLRYIDNNSNNNTLCLQIDNDDNTPFTVSTLENYIQTNFMDKKLPCFGVTYAGGSNRYLVLALYYDSTAQAIQGTYMNFSGGAILEGLSIGLSRYTIEDTPL